MAIGRAEEERRDHEAAEALTVILAGIKSFFAGEATLMVGELPVRFVNEISVKDK